MMLKFQMDKLH